MAPLLLRAAQVPVQHLGWHFWKPTRRTKARETGLLRSLPAQRSKGQPLGACSPSQPLGGNFRGPRSLGRETVPEQPWPYLSSTSGDQSLQVTEHVNPDDVMWGDGRSQGSSCKFRFSRPALRSGMGLGNEYFPQAPHVILKQVVPTRRNTAVGKQVSASWSEKVWAPSCPEAGV